MVKRHTIVNRKWDTNRKNHTFFHSPIHPDQPPLSVSLYNIYNITQLPTRLPMDKSQNSYGHYMALSFDSLHRPEVSGWQKDQVEPSHVTPKTIFEKSISLQSPIPYDHLLFLSEVLYLHHRQLSQLTD